MKTGTSFIALAALLSSVHAVHADLIISAGSITAAPGASGSLDVTLTNTGPSAVTVAVFGFGVTTSDPAAITFTDANMSTAAPYIFLSDSFAAAYPPFAFAPIPQNLPNAELLATDNSLSGLGRTLMPGQTFGLGHVLYDVASNPSPGPISVIFDLSATSLSDPSGMPLAFSTVPEPATVLLCLIGGGTLMLTRRQRARRGPPAT